MLYSPHLGVAPDVPSIQNKSPVSAGETAAGIANAPGGLSGTDEGSVSVSVPVPPSGDPLLVPLQDCKPTSAHPEQSPLLGRGCPHPHAPWVPPPGTAAAGHLSAGQAPSVRPHSSR